MPPGTWTDAWDGTTVTGPKTITASQPYERQPMWHRAGGLVVLADTGSEALRVEADPVLARDAAVPDANGVPVVDETAHEKGSNRRRRMMESGGLKQLITMLSAVSLSVVHVAVAVGRLRPVFGRRVVRSLVRCDVP